MSTDWTILEVPKNGVPICACCCIDWKSLPLPPIHDLISCEICFLLFTLCYIVIYIMFSFIRIALDCLMIFRFNHNLIQTSCSHH